MCADQEICKAFKVHGMVQGVGFRFWAHREGRRLGLRGLVRNCYDGTVEIAFAGPFDDVQAMSERLKSGPPAAHVVRLEELPAPDELPADFQIGF
jgi:acylphosphatase